MSVQIVHPSNPDRAITVTERAFSKLWEERGWVKVDQLQRVLEEPADYPDAPFEEKRGKKETGGKEGGKEDGKEDADNEDGE